MPGAHALTGERRHQVRGVAGEEDPPDLPPLGDPGLERVDGVALEPGVAGVHVPRARAAPTPAPPGSRSSRRLVGQAHELPPPAAGSARHRGGRPGRVADLEVERVEHPRLVEDDVDDQPVVEEAAVVDADVEQRRARSSWRRRSRRRTGRRPVPPPSRLDDDVVVVLLDARRRATPRRISSVGSDSARACEQRLELGLAEHRRERPARRARRRRDRSAAASCPAALRHS